MKFTRIMIAATACAALAACSGLPPSSAELAKTPQIRFGQALPEGDHFVLLFPAGAPLPVSTVVDGNLFEQKGQVTMHVTLKKDVYVYRQFASLDGVNWQPARELIATNLELQIPQKDGSHAGMLHLKIDQK